ncbi:MAG TPA: phosphotransferase [Gemmata sp.]|nr:phosphotransferase [Gemmata sp.]
MDKFTVLLVENQEPAHKICRDNFLKNGPVRMLYAHTVEEARPLIDKYFIHIALVDINLADDEPSGDNANQEGNDEGNDVLKLLCQHRPICRRYAYTNYPLEVLKQQGMGFEPTAHGVLPKQYNWTEVEFIKKNSQIWLKHQVRVDGLDEVLAEICRKMEPPHPIRDELDYLISKIFGQGEKIATSIESIELKLLDGGRSPSVVVLGQPKDGDGRTGIWTVIKFSSLRYAAMEHRAYCKYVRFMLPVSSRVELLGYFEADTIGAMCYSFAGGSPQNEIVSLERLIRDEDEETFKYLRALQSQLCDHWYITDTEPIEQAQYVAKTFKVDEDAVRDKIENFAIKIAPRIKAEVSLEGIRFADRLLCWPTVADLKHGQIRQRPKCIIHGDLHAGNVLVRRRTDQTVLIDHQYTGPGPAYLDFAALDASPRLFTKVKQLNTHMIEDQVNHEPKVWDSVWSASLGTKAPDELPFWARVSFHVVMMARMRFPGLMPKDYAGTCLLWALRVFKVDQLQEVPRVQLFVWISHLLNVLRAKCENPPAAS